jgi:hypothetical protein
MLIYSRSRIFKCLIVKNLKITNDRFKKVIYRFLDDKSSIFLLAGRSSDAK